MNLKLLLFFLTFSTFNFAQDTQVDVKALDDKYKAKALTIDATIKSVYAVISGEKGEERNEELLRYLFHPDAKLIIAGKNKTGENALRFITIDEYVENSLKWMFENGFFEKELHRETEQFGYIAHVFSSYASFYSETDETPFMRGINSFQLLHTGERWQVINVYFTQETEENPIPKKYLPH